MLRKPRSLDATWLIEFTDELVVLYELYIIKHTRTVEKNPHLSIESLSGSEEGSNDQQMMPELLNKAFSVKAMCKLRNL